MKKIILSVAFAGLSLLYEAAGQISPVEKGMNSINIEVLKSQTGFLASDWTEGRRAGEKGEYLAADYIAAMLQLYGVKPGGDYPVSGGYLNIQSGKERTYFQNFVLLKTTQGEEQLMKLKTIDGSVIKTCSFTYNTDYTIRLTNNGTEVEAPVIFVGYGFKNEKIKYDDLGRVEIKGKFLLKISGSPAFAREKLSPSELSASARDFVEIASARGAAGIIEFNPASKVVGTTPDRDFMNLSPSEVRPGAGRQHSSVTLPSDKAGNDLMRIVASAATANEILKGSGIVLNDYIRRADSNESNPVATMTGKSIYVKTSVTKEKINVRNIIGVIEGNRSDQVMVLGAHYDHMGIENGYIWNGADDNASGTAGIMTLARALMETGRKPEKTIIIALWTAEEYGLLGSRYYIENLSYPVKNLKFNLNFDMISRYISEDEKNKVIMTYTESYPLFRKLTEENLSKYGIDLEVEYQASADPPGGSDHRSFVAAGVPVLRFKPGHREEYHTPADEISTLDWDIMEKIVRISFANIWELSERKW